MNHLILRAAALAATLATTVSAGASPPLLDELLQRPEYESIQLSPGGDYLSARVPLEDRTVLAIVRRADMKITATVDPGKDGFVNGDLWVGDTRLFASTAMRFGGVAQPYQLGGLYATDVDGSHRRRVGGSVVDAQVNDPEHVLVAVCRTVVKQQCMARLQRQRTDGIGSPETLVDAPGPDARFMVDRKGAPVFSWGADDDDNQTTYVRRDGDWVPVNDERGSGVEVVPVGVSYDGSTGFLWSERADATDVIERIDLETLQRTVAWSNPQFDPASVVWSFDGSEPIGVRFGDGVPTLAFFDADHPHVALMRSMEAAFPGEFARITSTSRDGSTALVTVTSDREPGRFYILDTRSGDLSLLARGRKSLRPEAMAASRPFVMAARDGLQLHGLLTLPVSREDGSPAPLVVMPHGGPFGIADRWGFDDDVQLLAAQGYAVVRVNFRGSGGQGRPFIERGYGEWGAKMQDDLTDATRWAASQAGVDGRRICLWGASYGGYAALMGVVREPELYRCAIGFAGPYDLPTMYRWGDIQRSRWGRGRLAVTLGDDKAMLVARSPTHHAGRIKAALLLAQGGRDPRVSPEHAKLMAKALDDAGVPYETYFPPGQTHGLFTDKARRDYYGRVVRFLSRHLDGDG